jgi:lipoprotein-releasing system permease protein
VYQALLTRRYLTSKVMPLLAAVAVMLCTAMVLIVWSVMGGFLSMLIASGRTLIGDVAISNTTGISYYQDLILRLERDEDIEAATPVIETFGLVKLPYSLNRVIVKGIDAPSFDRVTGYADSLWWKPLDTPLEKDKERQDPRLRPELRQELQQNFDDARQFKAVEQRPPMTVGLEVGGYNERKPAGYVEETVRLRGADAMLSVVATDMQGRAFPEQQAKMFRIVNQFRSGLYEIDANTVFVPLENLQRMLKMDAAVRSTGVSFTIDPETNEERFDEGEGEQVQLPARVTAILVKAAEGRDADAVRDKIRGIYREFEDAHTKDAGPPPMTEYVRIQTWRDQNAMLIGAVEKETYLVLTIFGIVSLTAVFLVLAIFWAMVSEKTKDIGILRALGASRTGVAWLWLRYGLAIGIVGAILGGIAAYLIVLNINAIHEWIAVIGTKITGKPTYLWDPRVYYFTQIPSKIVVWKAAVVLCGGILASVGGALVPAIKAARMDPVRALRWE